MMKQSKGATNSSTSKSRACPATIFERRHGKWKVHDYDGAFADRRRALELDPALAKNPLFMKEQEVLALSFVNRSYGREAFEDDLAGALADLNQATELSPRMGRVYRYRASVKRSLGDVPGADADDAKAAELGFPLDSPAD